MDYHLVPVEEVAQSLGTTPAGLTAATAQQRLAEHGPNQIADARKKTLWQLVLHQLLDVMILVLLGAALVSGLMGELKSTYVILAIVAVNAVIGFIQEYRAEKAMEALKKMAASQAQVLRDGQALKVAAADLVPGDVVLLDAGNIIPADVRFIEAHALKVDESSLTGESTNVEKNPAPLPAGDHPLGDRLNLGFKGTFVTNGRATAYVVGTGMNTELGKIATLIQTEETVTPLQKRLATLGKRLAVAALVIGAVFFGVGWLRGEPLRELLLVSISLAIAALPEALPALVTVSLALGAKRLVDSHALIRKLPAVETLGSVTYICTDKTGTLTVNKMTVEQVFEAPKFSLPVLEPGHGLLTAMALNTDTTQDDKGQWLGDSTEVALARYAAEKEHGRAALEARFPRLAELPFDSERKCMSTLHQTDQGVLVITKGAMGSLFEQLDASQQADVPDLRQRVDALASQGHRVLGYAAKLLPALPAEVTPATIETGLSFIGFAGLIDPPRPEARQAVAECKAAGITAVMITGDHPLTAKAVAESLGIIASAQDLVLTGQELTKLDEPAFAAVVEHVRVYARVDPAQKLRIVQALQARHQFVAMTGDGVNDAPALKNADIGIAMGINGTEVSKEAAHMILLDDDFATIVEAVRHGRRIYGNILKFIRYIMAGSAGEICALFVAPFFGLPVPLLAIHILWINLITDGLPGLALAYEPSEPNSMQRPPIDPKQTIFSDGLGWFIVWVGLLVGGVTIGMQAWAIQGADAHWQTMTFSVLCFSQLGLAFTLRSRRESAFSIGLLSNKPMLGALVLTFGLQLMIIYVPFFNDLFRTQPLTWVELGITLAVSSIVFWAVEAQKLVGRRREAAPVVAEPAAPAAPVVAAPAPAAAVVPATAELAPAAPVPVAPASAAPAPVEPVVAGPAAPAAPVVAEPAAPAPAAPVEPVVAAPVAPVVAAPAPAVFVVATPAEPTEHVVAEPAPTAPVESEVAAPTEHVVAEPAPTPAAPVVAAPVPVAPTPAVLVAPAPAVLVAPTPAALAPVAPIESVVATPVAPAPVEPVVAEPAALAVPVVAEPAAPASPAPVAPVVAAPVESEVAAPAPAVPVVATPAEPTEHVVAEPAPNAPVESEVAAPTEPAPTPAALTPATPVESAVATPDAPVEPVVPAPAVPAPAVPAPAAPVVPAPAAPVVATPAAPAESVVAAPVAPTLVAPAPAVPVVAEPAVPAAPVEPVVAASAPAVPAAAAVATPATPVEPVVPAAVPVVAAPAPVELVVPALAVPVVAVVAVFVVAVPVVAVPMVAVPLVAAQPASPPVPEQENEPARNTIGHEAEPVKASPPKS